jgi:hypothetical protein
MIKVQDEITEKDLDGFRSYTVTYHSLEDFAAGAVKRNGGESFRYGDGDEWAGGASLNEVLRMSREGWSDKLVETLDIAESAVSMAEKEHMIHTIQDTVWDVAGDEVDIDRYLSGEPECMRSWPVQRVSKMGKVITLCASVCYSSAIQPETAIRRGQVIAALALAIQKLGHAVELWIDISSGMDLKGRIRVCLKGANDILDDSKVIFAYAHPSMLRVLGFMVWDGSANRAAQGGGYGRPAAPLKDLPEGTIYLPELKSNRNLPDADEFMRQYLGEIGLLAE